MLKHFVHRENMGVLFLRNSGMHQKLACTGCTMIVPEKSKACVTVNEMCVVADTLQVRVEEGPRAAF